MPQFPNRQAAKRKTMRFAERPEPLNRFGALLSSLGNIGPGRAERLKNNVLGILKLPSFEPLPNKRLYLGSRDLDRHGLPPRFA
jgi:hypothetical protein